MGGILCCKKAPKTVKQHELAFMGICTEGAYNDSGLIDAVFNKAQEQHQENQIFEAKDEDGDLPIHKAAYNGNPTVLLWIIEKWLQNNVDLNIDEPDSSGYSPLYLACYRGYQGPEELNSKTEITKQKRLECATILIERGADINFMSPKLRMTPLHWASFQDDKKLVEFLINNGAWSFKTVLGNTPIDIAGFCKNTEIVRVFCKDLEKKILAEGERKVARGDHPE